MTFLDFMAMTGTLICGGFTLVGIRCVWNWIQLGYEMERKHIRLGRGCVLIGDSELTER